MTKAARTVKIFGVYLVLLGVGLILLPDVLLGLFGMPQTSEVWIRVVGLLAFNEGVYYWYAAKSEATPFFRASIYVRSLTPAVFVAFVVAGWASPILVLFGVADLVGGIWTLLALRREQHVVRQGLAPPLNSSRTML